MRAKIKRSKWESIQRLFIGVLYVTYGIGLGMSVFTPITGVDHLSIRQYISHLRDVTLVFVDFGIL